VYLKLISITVSVICLTGCFLNEEYVGSTYYADNYPYPDGFYYERGIHREQVYRAP